MKLADALLRRKELNEKVDQLRRIKDSDLYEFRFERLKVNESLDDIRAQVPKCDISQVTEEYDFYAKRLRLIDAAIQRANWNTDVEVDSMVWLDYQESKK